MPVRFEDRFTATSEGAGSVSDGIIAPKDQLLSSSCAIGAHVGGRSWPYVDGDRSVMARQCQVQGRRLTEVAPLAFGIWTG